MTSFRKAFLNSVNSLAAVNKLHDYLSRGCSVRVAHTYISDSHIVKHITLFLWGGGIGCPPCSFLVIIPLNVN